MARTSPMARNIDLGELLGRVAQRRHVHRVHLHAGVGQEVVDDQHEAGQSRPLGQDVGGIHRGGGLVALAEEHQTPG